MAGKSVDYKKIVNEVSTELLEKLGITSDIEIKEEKDPEGGSEVLHVTYSSEKEAGLLIGAHGQTLHALQSFLAMAVRQQTGDWVRIVLDIGDWRQKHEDHLSSLAKQAAERAKSTGEPQHLYNLSPAQRRVVHMALTKEKGIETISEGEGEGRYLVVKAA